MKKFASVLLLLVLAAMLLTGCGGQNGKAGNAAATAQPTAEPKAAETKTETKEKVVVACWGNQMLDSYTQYLCELFPQVEFEFVLATNSTDYYRFRQDHEDMVRYHL